MPRAIRWLTAAVLVLAPTARTQQPEAAKKGDRNAEAEVHLLDSSNVRMLILDEKVEITTRFGKLTVPTKEILKIDFGVHIPAATEQKVRKFIEELGSDNYKTRELALKELVDLGPYAYPLVYQSTKSDLPEVAKRATMALEKIRAKHPAHRLRLREDDIITTTSFPIVGKITAGTFKARNETFGEVELKLAQVRAIRWTASPAEVELIVDSAKHGSAQNQWMDTEYEVRSGTRLLIVAQGQVNLWPPGGGYMTSPRGYNAAGPSPPGTQFQAGALVGRIGEDGTPFLIGERHELSPARDGKLYLHIIPSPWGNASTGTYQVKVTPRGELFGE